MLATENQAEITVTSLHPTFMARVHGLDLRQVTDEPTLSALRAAMAEHGVLVFKDQELSGQEQIAFALRLDGELHRKTSSAVIAKNRYGDEALTDISNVSEKGQILDAKDRRRINNISNRIWHTDASFEDPAGRYSMLYARTIPPVRADTQFADMRTAYEQLDAETKSLIGGLHAHHSIVYSRHVMGFDFSPEEAARLPGAVHPLVRSFSETPRQSLYLASHASRIMEWPIPEGRLLLRDLMEHAVQREYIHYHEWTAGDLVIWDNRMTMHRARPYDDEKYKRELTRVTTLDIARTH